MDNFLIKKKSGIHGIGIFTIQNIKKNSIFYQVPTDKLFNKSKSKLAYIGDNKWVSDEGVLNWVNHSCNPNSILKIEKGPVLVAKRDINEGEEITCDYSLTEKDGDKIKCNCKDKVCKGYFLAIK